MALSAPLRHTSLSEPIHLTIPSARHLLDVLRTMPLLESLVVQGAMQHIEDLWDQWDTFDEVLLPHLQQLTIRENCYHVLQCIHPGDGCCLFLEAVDESLGTMPFQPLEHMQNITFMWSSGYFKAHPPKAMRIHMKQLEHRIPELPFHSAGPQTRFYSSLRPIGTEHAKALHFASLDYTLFHSLAFIDIDASPSDADDSVFHFLLTIESLEVLSIPFSTLQFFSNHCAFPSPDEVYITFPSLKTLAVRNIKQVVPNLGADTTDLANLFITFLTGRQAEVPLNFLDLTECASGLPNMRFLDMFTGLRIIRTGPEGKEDSYVCGTGKPNTLQFYDARHIDIPIG